MQIVLTPWVHQPDYGEPIPQGWNVPKAIAIRDMRSEAQCEAPVAGWACAAFNDADVPPVGNTIALGSSLTQPLSSAAMRAVSDQMGVPITATRLMDIFMELSVEHADITGKTRFRPRMPNRNMLMRVVFAGEAREETYDPAKHPLVIPQEQWVYRKLRAEALDPTLSTPSDFHQQFLALHAAKYGINFKELIPDDLPIEQPKQSGTSFDESWNIADQDSPSVDLTWTEIRGDWDVVSNELGLQDVAGTDRECRCESTVDSDHKTTTNVTVMTPVGSAAGACARFEAAATTYYVAFAYESGGDVLFLRRVNAGSNTNLTNPSTTITIPDEIALDVTGSADLEGFVNGSSVATHSDGSPLTGQTRGGVHGFITSGVANNVKHDTWNIDDGITPGGRIMGALAHLGGLAGHGGMAGKGGGIAS